MSAPDIFLSYNREDADRARHFADGFAAAGFDVWWDVALKSGEAYDEVTENALHEAKAVVVLWSPRSVVSRWVRAEATIADQNKTLLPVTIETCRRPVMFELTQTTDLSHWQGDPNDHAWQVFAAEVHKFIGKEAPAAPIAAAGPSTSSDGGVPIVALLPLTCRAGDDELEALAEDLSDEITSEMARDGTLRLIGSGVMARYRGQSVDYRAIGRELGTRYLLDGKVQRVGANIRLGMQLIEVATTNVLWSEKYSRPAEDLDEVLQELTIKVAGQLLETILHCEIDRATKKTGALSGWEYFTRGCVHFGRISSHGLRAATEAHQQALVAAPDFGLAHALMANSLAFRRFYPTAGAQVDIDQIKTYIQRALELDGNNPLVLRILSEGPNLIGESDVALGLAQRAVALSPNASHGYTALGHVEYRLGHNPKALAAFAEEARLAPGNGLRYLSETTIAVIQFLLGDLAAANEAIDHALGFHPSYTLALNIKTLIADKMGEAGTAHAMIRRSHASEPDMTLDHHAGIIGWWIPESAAAAEMEANYRRLWGEAGLA